LKLRYQSIALLNHICVLLVLVIWSVRLYYLIDAIDGAWYAVCGDKFGEITEAECF
jgi:hypothetical protein